MKSSDCHKDVDSVTDVASDEDDIDPGYLADDEGEAELANYDGDEEDIHDYDNAPNNVSSIFSVNQPTLTLYFMHNGCSMIMYCDGDEEGIHVYGNAPLPPIMYHPYLACINPLIHCTLYIMGAV